MREKMKIKIGIILSVLLLLASISLSSNVQDLEIQVSPHKLVLSSHGGKFTIHTDTPFYSGIVVQIWVDTEELVNVVVFPDLQGNLVAQCSRDDVRAVISDFDGKTKLIPVKMIVGELEGYEEIIVKK
jgi:hypothetical protein